ncbi:hypothetical protein D9M68_934940 [compost metagenome]
MVLNSPATGMEPPEPVITSCLPHSAESPDSALRRNSPFAGTVMAGEPPWGMNSTEQSAGIIFSTWARKAARIFFGSMPETSRNEILADALAGITVLKPSPV